MKFLIPLSLLPIMFITYMNLKTALSDVQGGSLVALLIVLALWVLGWILLHQFALSLRGLFPDKKKKIVRDSLYFLRSGDRVKIGRAKDPEYRLMVLRSHIPYETEILAILPGAGNLEKRIHKLLQPYKIKGEWFEYNEEIQNLLDELKGV